MSNDLTDTRQRLSSAAWAVREHARILGNTRVGCAVLDADGRMFTGANIEHRFRSHDIHAEIAALSALIAAGGTTPVVVLVAAARDRFTPCGSCLDWIFELGGANCEVLVQRSADEAPTSYLAHELMPYYPM